MAGEYGWKFIRFATNLTSAIALFTLTNNILSSASEFPSQCTNYHNLAERNRNVNSNQPIRRPICDRRISNMQWYRFNNRAGSILTSKQVRTGMCGAQNPGWLVGDHPCTINETKAAQVCFVNQSTDCATQVNIFITLCGEYYVYRLPMLNCSKNVRGRYCGEDSEIPVPSCNITSDPIYPTTTFNTTNPGVYVTVTTGPTKAEKTEDKLNKMKNELDKLCHTSPSKERQKEVAQKIIKQLSSLTDLNTMGENEMKEEDLNDTIKILQTIVNLNISDNNLSILSPASNLLDSRNTKLWKNMTDDKLIRDLVITLENYGFQLKYNANTSTLFQNHSNVQLYVKFIKQKNNLSEEELLFKFTDALFHLSPDALPQSSGAVVVSMWFKTLNSFLTTGLADNNDYAEINSKIITASVKPEAKEKFLKPVRISWNMKELNDSATCVYWKPELNEKWKRDGCRRVKSMSNSQLLICECDHLTAFAAMDISREIVSQSERRALELISTIGCSVSLFGIILTILTYTCLWRRLQQNAKSKVPSQVLMHLCVAIGMTDILSIVAGPAHNYEKFCIAVSILLYFFVLAVFGWMLCEGVIIYLQLVNVYTGLSLGGKHLKLFYVIGWGIPVVVVAVLIALNDRKDFVTNHACWCRGGGVLFWTFVGTVSLILLINLVIFVLALRSALSSNTVSNTRSLSSTKDGTSKTIGTALRKAKLGLKGSAILLPLLGLTWVFGLLVFNRSTIVFKYLFAICNSLQGMMIFVFHVLINKKIHEAISKEKKAREVKHTTKTAVINNTCNCGTLSTSDGNRRKSSVPVTPTLPKKSFSESAPTVIQNNTTINSKSKPKEKKLYLEPERNQRTPYRSRTRRTKNDYTSTNNNNSWKSNRNKSECQFNAVILEDLDLP